MISERQAYGFLNIIIFHKVLERHVLGCDGTFNARKQGDKTRCEEIFIGSTTNPDARSICCSNLASFKSISAAKSVRQTCNTLHQTQSSEYCSQLKKSTRCRKFSDVVQSTKVEFKCESRVLMVRVQVQVRVP